MSAAPDFELYADQKTFNETIAPGWQSAFEKAVEASATPRETLVFLDVGCGDGKYYRHLLREGLTAGNIHGVEVSEKRVARCRDLGWENAAVFDGTHLPFGTNSIDIVNLMEVVEHVPEDMIAALLDEIRRVLRPSGHLLVSTPNYPIKRFYDFSDAFLHRKWDRLKDDPTHISFYHRKKLDALLARFFATREQRSFKDGYLYRRLPKPYLRHKLFFLCGGPR